MCGEGPSWCIQRWSGSSGVSFPKMAVLYAAHRAALGAVPSAIIRRSRSPVELEQVCVAPIRGRKTAVKDGSRGPRVPGWTQEGCHVQTERRATPSPKETAARTIETSNSAAFEARLLSISLFLSLPLTISCFFPWPLSTLSTPVPVPVPRPRLVKLAVCDVSTNRRMDRLQQW